MADKNKNVYTAAEESGSSGQVSTVKRVFSIVKTVFTWIVVVFAVFMMIFTIISTTTLNRNDRGLFGYKMFIVLSDSMSISEQDTTAEDRAGVNFAAGDLIFSKELEREEVAQLQPGDVITFQSQNGDNFGEVVTHKIRRLTTTAEGERGFVTYGINTNVDDETIVTYYFVLGRYSGKIPKLGKFLEFQKSTVGYITCIFVPFVILIIIQGIKSIRLFRVYKKEQHAELDAEKAELAAQKAETEKMMREMLELKAQLAGQGQTQQAPPADAYAQPAVEEQPTEETPAPQPEEDPLAAEKAALEAQKAETEKMMREMMELKARLDAQMNQQNDGSEGGAQ